MRFLWYLDLMRVEEVIDSSGRISHILVRAESFLGRKNIVLPDNEMQVCLIGARKSESFPAHIHIKRDHTKFDQSAAQEAWVILTGSVEATLIDENEMIVKVVKLGAGDCVITLVGGHRYVCLEESLIYEFKSGPYYGVSKDKRIISLKNERTEL